MGLKNNFKKNVGLNFFMIFAVLFIAILAVGVVNAEDDDDIDEDNSSETIVQSNALIARFEHIQCKVEFTNTQLDIIYDHVDENDLLEDYKDELSDDLNELKELVDDNNKKGFDAYLEEEFRPDMHNATILLNDYKKNFLDFNLSSNETDTVKRLINDAKKEYSECVSDKEKKMTKALRQYYKFTDKKWKGIIGNMERFNVSVDDAKEIKDELESLIEDLDDAIDSGNETLIRQTLQKIHDAHLHLWARFEVQRFNAYADKLGPMADKYGQGQRIHEIKNRLKDVEESSRAGYPYQRGDVKKVWGELSNVNKELKDTGKDILKERMKERLKDKDKNEGDDDKRRRGG
ncbi:MAG: hypothetical protein ACP5NV_04555 [Candidatus Woesearchaeota archaeon]